AGRERCLRGPGEACPRLPRYARAESTPPGLSASSLAERPYLPAAAPLGRRRRRLRRVAALIRDSQLFRKRSHAPRLLITHVQQYLHPPGITAANRRLNLDRKPPSHDHDPAVFLKQRHLVRPEEVRRPRIDRFAPNLRLFLRQPRRRLKVHARRRQAHNIVSHDVTP